ncbi:SusC/RagA family TonB-linked outer membrane protein [Sphingobacterium hotanense]|uniref:SusC/RagA family TonB-linked outer membrane protein n=1 Tax=Sphingobacterium hotanense TaxID=649196 RepID=UPI0021A82E0D|nr:TonB-dependent receptor [Sphingobacterium hotanense]MCT1523021.1 TonB-dependent receptor [Sphingobacterium hotanense]
MNHLKKSKSLIFKMFCLMFLLMQTAASYAQSIVRGLIKDEQNAPIAGATVKVKGKSQTVMSDELGSFEVQVDALPVTLQVQFLGYQSREVLVNNATNNNITLSSEDNALEEVMVVAYGTQKKGTMVGSVAQIKGDELKRTPTQNITNTLAGRLPGLTAVQQSGRPGADGSSLYVRGIGTYGSNRSPLVIIDDVERPSSTLAYLDPNEIESISVLKDAVATAAYGVQAANGIIIVKTKSGKESPAKVSYDFSYSIGQNTRFPEFLDGPDYMTWYNKGIEVDNDFLINTGQAPAALVYSQDLIDAVRNGTNTNPLFGNTDWIGMLVDNNSQSQHHSATITGGNSNTQYFAAINHMDQDGVVANTNFKRYNVRTNLNSRLTDYLSVGLNVGLRNQITNTPGISPDNTAYMNPFYQAVRTLPNMPMYAPNGLPTSYNSNAGYVNPLAAVERSGYQKYNGNVFQGQANITLRVPGVEGLQAKVQAAYDYSNQESKTWLTPYETMGRGRDQVTGDYVALSTLPGITKSTLRQSYSADYRKTLQASMNYDKVIATDHNLSVLALYEYSGQKGNLFSTGAANFPIDIIQEINYGSKDPLDYVMPTGSSDAEQARAGMVARVNYSYKSKYLLEAAARWDASANFSPENRWKSFPGVGLGWVVSNEDFFADFKGINYLKLKTSYGKSGNDRAQVGTFPYLATFVQNTAPVVVIDGKPVTAIYTSNIPNPSLKWEESTMFNVGFESFFLDNKLGFDFEWFYRHTTGILGSVGSLYPASIGGYYPSLANIGEMDNRGFDAQIKYNDMYGDFRLGLTGNINWSKNRYLKYQEPDGTPSYLSVIGRSVGEKTGFVVDGMIQTWEEANNAMSPSSGIIAPGSFKFRDLNGDGRLTRAEDMTFIGRSNVPELTFGLNIDMAYKGFDFSALFQGAALADVTLAGTYEGSSGTTGVDDNTPFTRTFYGFGNSPYFLVENSWTPDNPNAEFPRLSSYKATGMSAHNANKNSAWIRKGDYLRLKSVQLGYTLPKTLTERAKIENVRLFVTGSNLFTWDYLKYLDPEMPNVNNGFYPQQRIYSFGLNVTF